MDVLRVGIHIGREIIRDGLSCLLDREEGVTVVSEDEGTLRPDAVLAYLGMQVSDQEFLQSTLRNRTDEAILAIGDDIPVPLVQTAISMGVAGYVEERSGISEVVQGLKGVTRGDTYLDSSRSWPDWLQHGVTFSQHDPQVFLTEREQEVLALTAEGLTSREIGERLSISHRTAENHISSLREKLDVPNKAALVRKGLELGLIGRDRAGTVV